LGVGLVIGAVAAVLGALFVPTAARWWTAPGVIRAGRIALIVSVAVSIPACVGSVTSSAQR
ncbi:MAG: hypothetical protein LH624_00710, partial [Cryobacterium sp.]|nr:hypothetical protein [Cryobacterium sp.]